MIPCSAWAHWGATFFIYQIFCGTTCAVHLSLSLATAWLRCVLAVLVGPLKWTLTAPQWQNVGRCESTSVWAYRLAGPVDCITALICVVRSFIKCSMSNVMSCRTAEPITHSSVGLDFQRPQHCSINHWTRSSFGAATVCLLADRLLQAWVRFEFVQLSVCLYVHMCIVRK